MCVRCVVLEDEGVDISEGRVIGVIFDVEGKESGEISSEQIGEGSGAVCVESLGATVG